LHNAGCEIVEDRLAGCVGPRGALALIGQILAVALATGLDALGMPDDEISALASRQPGAGAGSVGDRGLRLTNRMAELSDAVICALFSECDVVLAPILSGPPPPLGHFPTDHTDIDAHLAKMEAMAPNAALPTSRASRRLAIPAGNGGGPAAWGPIDRPAAIRPGAPVARRKGRPGPAADPYPYPIAGMPE
jgi:amidase